MDAFTVDLEAEDVGNALFAAAIASAVVYLLYHTDTMEGAATAMVEKIPSLTDLTSFAAAGV